MQILLTFFIVMFVLGFIRGLLGGQVHWVDRSAARPVRRRRDPLSPEELHTFHRVHGTPGW